MPVDSNSDGANDAQIDADLIMGGGARNHVYDMNGVGAVIPNNLSTLQPRSSGNGPNSQEDDEADDVYPYLNPSPIINKPTIVGGLS